MRFPFRRRRRAMPTPTSEPRFQNPYFASSEKPVKGTQQIILELTALCVVFIGLLSVVLGSSLVFGITSIEVRGNERIAATALQQNVATALASRRFGVFPTSNMLTVSAQAIRNHVQASYAVERVTVQRKWPHQLVVTIKELYPSFALQLGTDRAALMTEQGSVAELVSDLSTLHDYPVLVLSEPLDVTIGENILATDLSAHIPDLSGKLRSANFSVKSLNVELPECPSTQPEPVQGTNTNANTNDSAELLNSNTNTNAATNTAATVTSCTLSDRLKRTQDVRVQLEQGYGLILSMSEDIDRQLAKYKELMTQAPDTVIHEYVDLRVPGRIYYK